MSGRIDTLAHRAADRWRGRIADRLRAVGGVEIEQLQDGVAVRGRRLRARWLRDARLRWFGGWM